MKLDGLSDRARSAQVLPMKNSGVSAHALKAVFLEVSRRVELEGGEARYQPQDMAEVLNMNRVTLWRCLAWLKAHQWLYFTDDCEQSDRFIGIDDEW